MIKLTPRLQLVADTVNKCDSFLDVGTDHAYLPAYLVNKGVARTAIASDINPNPLKNAKKTLDAEELQQSVTLRLSAGFQNIESYEAQEIAVAGMGGIMIADMINSTPWLKDKSKHLILQPMTHSEDVRLALHNNGFLVESEQTVSEGRRIYLVISARYTGDSAKRPLYWYYVGNLFNSKNSSDRAFAEKEYLSIKKKYEGLLKSGVDDEKTLELLRSIENVRNN